MAAQQRAYNARQEAELERGRGAPMAASPAAPSRAEAVSPLAERMSRPPADDIADLRRQQAEFKKTERAVSRQNAWLAVPALAPVAAVAGLEAAGAIRRVSRPPWSSERRSSLSSANRTCAWATIGRRGQGGARTNSMRR